MLLECYTLILLLRPTVTPKNGPDKPLIQSKLAQPKAAWRAQLLSSLTSATRVILPRPA
jgi:hypothetical protein